MKNISIFLFLLLFAFGCSSDWTTGLMGPEAYTIHDAITGYIHEETNEEIRLRAAKAYSKYQKCSLGAAKRLLVTN